MKNFLDSVTQYFSPELINSCKRISKFLLIYTVLFILLAMGLKYAIPFVIALLIAMSLRPIKNRILCINKRLKKFKLTDGFVSMVLTITIVAVAAFLLFIIGFKIAEQLNNFYTYITDKNTLNNINITGKNILKDNSKINITDIFSSQQSNDEINNHILNSNLSNENIIK